MNCKMNENNLQAWIYVDSYNLQKIVKHIQL